MGRIEADLHLKVGCSDFGPARDRGSFPYLDDTYLTTYLPIPAYNVILILPCYVLMPTYPIYSWACLPWSWTTRESE